MTALVFTYFLDHFSSNVSEAQLFVSCLIIDSDMGGEGSGPMVSRAPAILTRSSTRSLP